MSLITGLGRDRIDWDGMWPSGQEGKAITLGMTTYVSHLAKGFTLNPSNTT